MASINTNAGAMTALQTLKATNKAMDTTQNRIATGFRVNQASDNAAYWSLATTMRSDNQAMGTVQDALGLGAAQVDVAYTAMDVVKDTLDTIKSKLVAASQPGVDKSKIQAEISQLHNDLETYAESATFSGGNWLSVDGTSTQQVVASFVRDGNGGVSLQTIDVNTAKIALFNKDAGQSGILEEVISVSPGAEVIDISAMSTPPGTPGNGSDGATASIDDFADVDWKAGDKLTFSVKLNGSTTSTEFTVEASVDGFDLDDFNDAFNAVFGSGVVVATLDGDNLVFTGDDTASATLSVSGLSAATAGTGAVDVSVSNFDISELNRADIQTLISKVDETLGRVTTAASDLGAIKSRIDSQSSFVGKIMDAVDRGIGQLVDADMTEESSRLQALQVQQQLGIQALSMANGNSQIILSLFR